MHVHVYKGLWIFLVLFFKNNSLRIVFHLEMLWKNFILFLPYLYKHLNICIGGWKFSQITNLMIHWRLKHNFFFTCYHGNHTPSKWVWEWSFYRSKRHVFACNSSRHNNVINSAYFKWNTVWQNDPDFCTKKYIIRLRSLCIFSAIFATAVIPKWTHKESILMVKQRRLTFMVS